MATPRATVGGIEFRLVENMYFEARNPDGSWSLSGDSVVKVAGLARLLGFVHPSDAPTSATDGAPAADESVESADLSELDLAGHIASCAESISVALGDAPRIHRNVLLRPHVVMRWRDTLLQLAEALR